MTSKQAPRLIEVAFPLMQTSLDSVHEKNVRHGHISTLHIWPARRPLAACRAALIATLLPDPGNDEERNEMLKRLGGTLVQVPKKRKLPSGKIEERLVDQTLGGILHWGRESGPDLEWFRQKIREAYGGRAPKVLDPFAGGGAIPLEAMRLGCEVTAVDINPVAWFILKCTLEYPQKLVGQLRPLPHFALDSPEFMEGFFKGTSKPSKKKLEESLKLVQARMFPVPDVDLSWHVRAWGWWVLQRAKADLESFYPVIDGKPTVAYLWARTVTCKHCRATIPLLKTRWLCKKDNKRVLLTMQPNDEKTGVVFEVQTNVPQARGTPAQRREHDKQLGAGTISKSGATCPCCGVIMKREDLQQAGAIGGLDAVMTAVVIEGLKGKEYRRPMEDEIRLAAEAQAHLSEVYTSVPFGLPDEPVPRGGSRVGGGSPFTVYLYGLTRWCDLFSHRQMLALGVFTKHTRAAFHAMLEAGYSPAWIEAITAYLALALSRLTDRSSTICHWSVGFEKIQNTFSRFALSVSWDYSEANPLASSSGTYDGQFEWISQVVEHCALAEQFSSIAGVRKGSATQQLDINTWDVITTDPPYYDAIPYSDLMDFFYVWLRRALHGLTPDLDAAFSQPLSPKWDQSTNDGELIDDASRFGGDKKKSKAVYEDGMYRAFQTCYQALNRDGRLVIVFAHKHPDAWETLVSAIIKAGFVVDGSWPIQTEMGNRTRALSSAALSSSVWLVCKKRAATARPGWDGLVLTEMRDKIQARLRSFWDSGIRGPDFVWAATGPALESYSQYPAVRKANDQSGIPMSVTEFLGHVRRMVVDFVVGRVLTRDGASVADAEISELDEVTTYYLLHRHDFSMGDAPIGACILYAVSCGLSDHALVDQFDILVAGSSSSTQEADADETESEAGEEVEPDEAAEEESAGNIVRLRPWQQRKRKGMGYDAPGGRSVPLIDQIHRLMHLWKTGEKTKVDEYLNDRALWRNALFLQVLQSLVELSSGDERTLLESISNHVAGQGAMAGGAQPRMIG